MYAVVTKNDTGRGNVEDGDASADSEMLAIKTGDNGIV